MDAEINSGCLYVIATPIGNLADISERMRDVIGLVDCLYAEDTRHTGKLCQYLGLKPQLRSLHDHNEADRVGEIVARLQRGDVLGVVSDAGTPLISDPGYRIVSACHEHGIRVSPVVGPSAVTAALSVCGLPTDRFCYYGFLPARSAARRSMLKEIASSACTSVLLESRHRIVNSLNDICQVLGEDRQICVARELTKTFESVMRGQASEVYQRVLRNSESQKGEFVIVIRAESDSSAEEEVINSKTQALLTAIAAEIPPRKAAALVADYSGLNKKTLYDWLVAQKRNDKQ